MIQVLRNEEKITLQILVRREKEGQDPLNVNNEVIQDDVVGTSWNTDDQIHHRDT